MEGTRCFGCPMWTWRTVNMQLKQSGLCLVFLGSCLFVQVAILKGKVGVFPSHNHESEGEQVPARVRFLATGSLPASASRGSERFSRTPPPPPSQWHLCRIGQ
jgi:hypothetical protein